MKEREKKKKELFREMVVDGGCDIFLIYLFLLLVIYTRT